MTRECMNLGKHFFLRTAYCCGKNEENRAENCGENVFPFVF